MTSWQAAFEILSECDIKNNWTNSDKKRIVLEADLLGKRHMWNNILSNNCYVILARIYVVLCTTGV